MADKEKYEKLQQQDSDPEVILKRKNCISETEGIEWGIVG